jgi:hypothetical protein
MVATALYGGYGWIAPALLFSFYGLLGLIAAVLTQETWGRAEQSEVEHLARSARQARAATRHVTA